MKQKSVIIHADSMPIEGIVDPGPHQTYQNPRVTVETRELGQLLPDNIRVEMVYAGLCGTDVHLVETNPETGYIRSSAPAQIPPEGRIIGHEGVGRILEIGSHVRHVKPGDYVTFESIIVCHYCDVCRKGKFNQCRHAKLLGLEEDGLFGTIVDVPAMLTHNVSALAHDERGLRAATCVEPAGVAYVACQSSRITGGDVIVVFGAGPIGLFSAIISKVVFGASVVHVVEPVSFRRGFAKKWSDYVYDVEEFFDTFPHPVDVVIEASGNLNNINRIFRQVNVDGRVVLLARSGSPLMLDAVDHMITNAVSVIGSRGHLGGAFTDILNLYKQGRIPLDDIVTSVVRGPEALCGLLQSTDSVLHENCKVLVSFNGDTP